MKVIIIENKTNNIIKSYEKVKKIELFKTKFKIITNYNNENILNDWNIKKFKFRMIV